MITANELRKKLDGGEKVTVLDVREPFEFVDWHIPGAINIPISLVMARPELDFPKDSEIIAVCAHGMRSAVAVRYLKAAGFENASSLEGGMVQWNSIYDVVEIEDIVQFRRIGKGCLSYIIVNGAEAVIIDPTIDVDIFLGWANARGLKIVAAVDTHTHADHASGGRMLAKMGIPYYCAEIDGSQEPIRFGYELLAAIPAPGHTPGGIAYKFGNYLFTGDTLFVDGVGRPDLGQDAAENAPILYDTIQKLLGFDDMIILPGHAEISEIKKDLPVKESLEELRELPLLKKSKEEFIQWVSEISMPAPENFEILKEYNAGKIAIDSIEEFRELEAGANRCAVK